MHAAVVLFIVNEFIDNTNGNSLDSNKTPFAYLLKYKRKKIEMEKTITAFWPEVLNRLTELYEIVENILMKEFSDEEKECITSLCNFSTENYGCLEYADRILLMKTLKSIFFQVPSVRTSLVKTVGNNSLSDPRIKAFKELKELNSSIKKKPDSKSTKEKDMSTLLTEQRSKMKECRTLLEKEIDASYNIKLLLQIDKTHNLYVRKKPLKFSTLPMTIIPFMYRFSMKGMHLKISGSFVKTMFFLCF